MRGLKYSSEQVCKATDGEWFGAELSKTLATEALKSRQRRGQRGYVDVETEGQPTEEPPADTRQDVNQILEAVVPRAKCARADSWGELIPWIQRCQKLQNQVLR